MTAQSRSEQVRSRRNQRRPAKKSRRSTLSSASRGIPPMVARRERGNMTDRMSPTRTTRGKGKSRKEARRRYNVALSTPGAEMSLPAMPSVRIGWRLLSAVMCVGLIWALYTVWTAPAFIVTSAQVEGLERLSAAEINSVMKVAGEPIFTIDPQEQTVRLEQAFPELSGISVQVSLPAVVTVAIAERQPVLSWTQGGVEYWVDINGIFFLPRGQIEGLVPVIANAAPPAPLVEEGQPQRLISPELVQAILTLYEKAPKKTVMAYDPQHGLGWEDRRGWQVYFGMAPEDMPSRLTVYKAIIKYLKNEGIQPAFISVEYLHAPYYRLTP